MVLNQKGEPLETHRIPVISTAHIDQMTDRMLQSGHGRKKFAIAVWEYGYFIHLDDVDDTAPQCLRDIADWLKKHQFTDQWVRLEADAEKADGLTAYEWV